MVRKQSKKQSTLKPVKALQGRLCVLDMVEVTGSTPVGPTTETPSNALVTDGKSGAQTKTINSESFPSFPPVSEFWCGNGVEKPSFYAGLGGPLNIPLHRELRTAESGTSFYVRLEITPDFSTKGWGSGLAPYAEPEGFFNLVSKNRLRLFGSAPFYSWVNCAVRHSMGNIWGIGSTSEF